jgi:Trk K+ transport system NAD-binding subunit
VAPRGIVAASVASLFAISLTQRGINGGDSIKALVFLTIILTVFVQALTAQGVANLLNITSQAAKGAVIVGCNPLSLLVARLLKEKGEPVVLLDTDPEAKEQAAEEKIPIFISSALDTDVLERAGLASKGTFLAMTSNGEVNLVVAQRAEEEFGPPQVLAIFPRDPEVSTVNTNSRIKQAFLAQIPIKTWSQYITDGSVKLGETDFTEDRFETQQTYLQNLIQEESLVPLLVVRGDRTQIASAEETWQVGDRLIYLLHDPKPELLKLLSGSTQPRLTPEKLPEVEKAIELVESELEEEAVNSE